MKYCKWLPPGGSCWKKDFILYPISLYTLMIINRNSTTTELLVMSICTGMEMEGPTLLSSGASVFFQQMAPFSCPYFEWKRIPVFNQKFPNFFWYQTEFVFQWKQFSPDFHLKLIPILNGFTFMRVWKTANMVNFHETVAADKMDYPIHKIGATWLALCT